MDKPPALSMDQHEGIILCKCASMNQETNVRKPVMLLQILSLKLMALTLKQGELCFQEIILIQNVGPFSSDFLPGLACLFLFFIARYHLFFFLLLAFVIWSLDEIAILFCANCILSIFLGNHISFLKFSGSRE